jgi:hypothetical protein
MRRITLTPEQLRRAIAMLRAPKPIAHVAREFCISDFCLRSNLRRAGALSEFMGRNFSAEAASVQHIKQWDESIANKYLQMKLRRSA